MIGWDRFTVAEAEEPTRARYPVAGTDLAGLAPAGVGEHLVVWGDPQLRAVTELQAHALGLALVEALRDRPDVELPSLVGGHDRAARTLPDDVFDAVREAARRIEDLGTGGETLVLHYLDPGAITDDFDAVFDRFDATDVEPDGGIELERATTRRGFG